MVIDSISDVVKRAANAVAQGATQVALGVYANLPSIDFISSRIWSASSKSPVEESSATTARPIPVVRIEKVPSADEVARRREQLKGFRIKLATAVTALQCALAKTKTLNAEHSRLRRLKYAVISSSKPKGEKEAAIALVEGQLAGVKAQIDNLGLQIDQFNKEILEITDTIKKFGV